MFYAHRCFPLLLSGLILGACPATPSQAAPPDLDYETIVPAPDAAVSVPPASPNPLGLAASPLAIADRPTGPYPEMRFLMRDGSVLVGQVLGFDGQMYALRLPHSTLLARKDLFTAVTPVSAGGTRRQRAHPVRAVGAHVGARY